MTIVSTTDWQRLVNECGADLVHWHPRWRELDWSAMLDQPGWYLLTDGAGSWCLLEPVAGSTMGHLIIAADQRGAAGLRIAQQMLAWIAERGINEMVATPNGRKTRLFLRWLGFEDEGAMMRLACTKYLHGHSARL